MVGIQNACRIKVQDPKPALSRGAHPDLAPEGDRPPGVTEKENELAGPVCCEDGWMTCRIYANLYAN